MEKPSFVKGGELRLPIGFRFYPTDEELVAHYLRRKALNFPLPAAVIPEFEVFRADPWALPGDWKEKRYFFSKRKWNGSKCSRILNGCGYWKATGKDSIILASPSSDQVVGLKKTLAFYAGKGRHGTKTSWVMHEYRLVCFDKANPYSTQKSMMEMEDWVICCIFQKKVRSCSGSVFPQPHPSNCRNNILEGIRPCEIDLNMVEDGAGFGPPQPPSPCSSGITEVSSDESGREETSAFSSKVK